MQTSATVIADSLGAAGKQLTSVEVVMHRFVLAELNTHRMLSRSAGSSRAIPTKRLLEIVRTDPMMPVRFGKNQPGMQASEGLTGDDLAYAKSLWRTSAGWAAGQAEKLAELGVHKEVTNRALEPYLPVRVLITATEWENFFALRCHKDAQPEIRQVAEQIRAARNASVPVSLEEGQWHLPYVTDEEIERYGGRCDSDGVLRKVSAARAARTSYKTHDGRISSIEEDLALCDRLTPAGEPAHSSPFEHQGSPDKPYFTYSDGQVDWYNRSKHGNFVGFLQARKLMPNECVKG